MQLTSEQKSVGKLCEEALFFVEKVMEEIPKLIDLIDNEKKSAYTTNIQALNSLLNSITGLLNKVNFDWKTNLVRAQYTFNHYKQQIQTLEKEVLQKDKDYKQLMTNNAALVNEFNVEKSKLETIANTSKQQIEDYILRISELEMDLKSSNDKLTISNNKIQKAIREEVTYKQKKSKQLQKFEEQMRNMMEEEKEKNKTEREINQKEREMNQKERQTQNDKINLLTNELIKLSKQIEALQDDMMLLRVGHMQVKSTKIFLKGFLHPMIKQFRRKSIGINLQRT